MKLVKKIIRNSVIAVLLAFSLGHVGAAPANAQGPLKEILDRMDGNYKTLSSFSSKLTMVKYNEQIGSRDTTEGTTSFLPPSKKTGNKRYIRIDWTKPLTESIVVMGDEYLLYRPAIKQAIRGNTAKAKNSSTAGGALAFIGMSKAQLQANYIVQYVGQEGISDGTPTWHILMTPKAASSYKSADLWVDKDGMPRQATIKEQNDDTTTVLLTNINKNVEVKAAIFNLNVPAGTKVISG